MTFDHIIESAMSSKRGRKRDDNLPPNRARDVQRAFRAKRAAHLQALEQLVDELEEENKYYRKVLDLPPSPRPSLGRGPTGKDWPDHDADKSRRQPASPCEESAGSPLSRTSSPELGHSPIAPSKSSLTITMDVDSPHRAMAVNDRHTAFQSEQGGESISIFPFKTPISLNHSDRNPHRQATLCRVTRSTERIQCIRGTRSVERHRMPYIEGPTTV